jgi:hypothetical protein
MKFARTTLAPLSLTIALLAVPAQAAINELVSSSESHSIEEFDPNGIWIKTFASTGPYIPESIAVSPLPKGDVFVSTLTQTILRYNKAGAPLSSLSGGSYWTTFNLSSVIGSNVVGGMLFDKGGNLYLATQYGTDGYQVEIFKFEAKELLTANPAPSGSPWPIVTTLGRASQLTFDAVGDICAASFAAPNTVQCFSLATGALAFDYASEIQAAGIQPVGLSFSPSNILTVDSVFTGQVWMEQAPRVGPMFELASGLIQEVNMLTVDSSGNLYVASFNNPGGRYAGAPPYDCTFYACMDTDFTPDLIYQINPSTGAVTNFISNHIWGPYQMIFVP